MAHHAIKRLGPTGLIAIFIALTMSLVGAGAAIAAVGSPNKAKGPIVAHTKAGKMKAPVNGTTEDGRKVKGTFTPSEFKAVNDALVVTGTLKGKFYGKGAPKAFEKEITTPVKDASVGAPSPGKAVAGCDILNLVLGPLDLNILGLEVHLDTVVLDIIAQPGPGQLLGNLLCAVAGLLDGVGLGGVLGDLLNQLVGLLEDILGQLGL
jgi:hypothetical protein